MKLFSIAAFLSSAWLATAQSSPYGQCAGQNWQGPTSCTGGWTCQYQNPWYSQCLPGGNGGGSGGGGGGGNIPVVVQPTYGSQSSPKPNQFYPGSNGSPATLSTSTIPAVPTSGSSGGSQPQTGVETTPGGNGLSGRATTTHYYDGLKGACGCGTGNSAFPWQNGRSDGYYTAAGSQALFQGPSEWCGMGCGACYKLTSTGQPPTSGSGSAGPTNSIVVMVTNLCPAQGNEQWCSSPTNQYGFGYHFDLMNSPPGWDNPVVNFESVACPGSMANDYKQCQCQGGKAVS